MMWRFRTEETSPGVYRCTGTRETGNVVSLRCEEHDFHRVLELAFDLEFGLGTLPSKALFLVISGSKPGWQSRYHNEAFGSWLVANPKNDQRIIYDGKDFGLMIYDSNESPVWQGTVRNREDVVDHIFEMIHALDSTDA